MSQMILIAEFITPILHFILNNMHWPNFRPILQENPYIWIYGSWSSKIRLEKKKRVQKYLCVQQAWTTTFFNYFALFLKKQLAYTCTCTCKNMPKHNCVNTASLWKWNKVELCFETATGKRGQEIKHTIEEQIKTLFYKTISKTKGLKPTILFQAIEIDKKTKKGKMETQNNWNI